MSIPFSLYEKLERKFGRDEAVEITKMIEDFITEMRQKAETIGIEKKLELKDELTKELASKADIMLSRVELEGKIETVRAELESKIEKVRTELESKIEAVRTELEGKIENTRIELEKKIEIVRAELQTTRAELKSEIERLNLKLNLLIVLVIIALTLMNPVVAEIVKKWFGIH